MESQCGVSVHDPFPLPAHGTSTSYTAPHAPVGENACPWIPWAADASSEPQSQPKETHPVPTNGPPSRTPQSLVDYDSSEPSDEEATDEPLANSKQTSLCQEMPGEIRDLPRTCKGKERSREPQARPLLSAEPNSPFSDDGGVAPFLRTVRCLEELQRAIYRLQEKNLFPYNPAALLKLLKGVEAKCEPWVTQQHLSSGLFLFI